MSSLGRTTLFLFILTLLSSVHHINANCDSSSCPIMCVSSPCPAVSSGTLQTIDPVASTTTCQEVIIQSPGYPNGYPSDECEWMLIGDPPETMSFVVTVLDFDGESTDTLRIQTDGGDLVDGNSDIINGDGDFPYFAGETVGFQVNFAPAGVSYNSRGFKIRIDYSESDTPACSTSESVALTDVMPVGAIHSPRYPRIYPNNAECYYTVTSPANTQMILQFIGTILIQRKQDYLFVYDDAGQDPQLLYIISHSFALETSSFRELRTKTNSLKFAFMDNPGTRRAGFFIRVSYEDVPAACSGHGTLVEECDCSGTTMFGSRCEDSNTSEFAEYPNPMSADLTSALNSCGNVNHQFSYGSSNANALVASPYYFSGTGASMTCRWTFSGPAFFRHVLIIRAMNIDVTNGDVFEVKTGQFGIDQERIIRYSAQDNGVLDLPVDRAGETFALIDTPIYLDNRRVTVEYEGSSQGVLFEMHLLDNGFCVNAPCLNGGQCTGYCDCDAGYQGEQCEQTLPPDFTCLVNRPYIPRHFAYPVKIYAIAGTNVFGIEKFKFKVHGRTTKFRRRVPFNSEVIEETYGNIISMPGECDRKDSIGTRFGALACIFNGNKYVGRCDIPVIVNPISEYIRPVGRFTKTVSVGDAEVSLSVDYSGVSEHAIRWRVNTLMKKRWNGRSTITIENIEIEDDGIYDAFIFSEEGNEYDIVTYRLIVRECADGFYGPPECSGACPICLNGGTCSDVYGTCVCPPGYAGTTCDELLTKSTISKNPDLTCPGIGVSYAGCKYVQQCLPDPGGCMCMPGWSGPACDQACPPLTFGLECQFQCHCLNDDQCDPATGACASGCTASFEGPNCQASVD